MNIHERINLNSFVDLCGSAAEKKIQRARMIKYAGKGALQGAAARPWDRKKSSSYNRANK